MKILLGELQNKNGSSSAPSGAVRPQTLHCDPRDFGFSLFVTKVMRDAHVCTVEELIRYNERQLLRWRGLGPKGVAEIKIRLRVLGLTLVDKNPETG